MQLHVVLFKFFDTVSEEERIEISQRLAGLGEACGGAEAGIIQWRTGWNMDRRKGYVLMETALFADSDAFARFKAHPEHIAFAETMSRHADWVVGDLDQF